MRKQHNQQGAWRFTQRILQQSLQSVSGFMARSCRHMYYRTKESFGQHKRDIIVLRVEEACASLEDTRVHFEDALQRFKEIVQADNSSLEIRYKHIRHQFNLSESKANAVSERIRAIEEVSEALFLEWETELDQYINRTLRTQSRRQLKSTRQHYSRLIKAMHRAEAKINPVLSAFRDQVLFLKHNLNAQAIASLQHELVDITVDTAQLVNAMESSINEANSFVATLVGQRSLPNPE